MIVRSALIGSLSSLLTMISASSSIPTCSRNSSSSLFISCSAANLSMYEYHLSETLRSMSVGLATEVCSKHIAHQVHISSFSERHSLVTDEDLLLV